MTSDVRLSRQNAAACPLLFILPVLMLMLTPARSGAQTSRSGGLSGTTIDERGEPLGGVTVTVSSESLIGTSRSLTSGADGSYRVLGLPPGLYLVVMEMAGRKPVMRNAHLELGQILTIDGRLAPGPRSEVTVVLGPGPHLEGRSAAADSRIQDDLLALVPLEPRFGAGVFSFTAGVRPSDLGAFGVEGPGASAWLVDGAETSHPRTGRSQELFATPWVQDLRAAAPGAGADEGGFTGISAQRLLRSGSNIFRASVDLLIEDGWLTSSNLDDDLLERSPDLDAPTLGGGVDLGLEAGGAVIRDRFWAYGGYQYARSTRRPPGFTSASRRPLPEGAAAPADQTLRSPRVLIKPTARTAGASRLSGYLTAQSLDREAVGAGPSRQPGATTRDDSSALAWNATLSQVLDAGALVEIETSGTTASLTRRPYNGDSPGWYDVSWDVAAANAAQRMDSDARRYAMSGTFSFVRSDVTGQHDVRLGAGFSRIAAETTRRTPGGMTVLSAEGSPFYAVLWDGAHFDDTATTVSLFGQDRWLVSPRLTVTAGLRLDVNRGRIAALDETVFRTTPVSPRLGVAWDVSGTSRTVVRASYGYFADAMRTAWFERADPAIAPVYGGRLTAGQAFIGPIETIDPGTQRTVDANINQPGLHQWSGGVDHELLAGVFISVNGIWRSQTRFLDDVLQAGLAEFEPVLFGDPGPDGRSGTADDTGESVTLYEPLSDAADRRFRITNPAGAERHYRAVEIAGRKRLSNAWQVQGSWVVGKLTGTYEPSTSGAATGAFDSPNTDPAQQPRLDGTLAGSRTHLISAIGSYQMPRGVLVSGAFRRASGVPYARTALAFLSTGPLAVPVEGRGSQREHGWSQVDVHVERPFDLPHRRTVVVLVDGFNLTNGAGVLSRTVVSGPAYLEPREIVFPRRFRIGARLRF